jgi:predicted ATPase
MNVQWDTVDPLQKESEVAKPWRDMYFVARLICGIMVWIIYLTASSMFFSDNPTAYVLSIAVGIPAGLFGCWLSW